jgi:hypothetical protein
MYSRPSREDLVSPLFVIVWIEPFFFRRWNWNGFLLKHQ